MKQNKSAQLPVTLSVRYPEASPLGLEAGYLSAAIVMVHLE